MSAVARSIIIRKLDHSSTMKSAYLTGANGQQGAAAGAAGLSAKIYEFSKSVGHSSVVGSGGVVVREYPGYLLAVFGTALGLFLLAFIFGAGGWLADDDRLTYAAMACFGAGAIAFIYSTRKATQTSPRTAQFVQGDQEATQ
jgi:hypothetical protein